MKAETLFHMEIRPVPELQTAEEREKGIHHEL